MSKSKLKTMIIVFLDIKGVIMTEPQRQIVILHYNIQILLNWKRSEIKKEENDLNTMQRISMHDLFSISCPNIERKYLISFHETFS